MGGGVEKEVESFLEATAGLQHQPSERWNKFTKELPNQGYDSSYFAWKTIFENWERSDGPCPCWTPDSAQIAATNLQAWIDELDLESVTAFHAWSVNHRAEFWETALDFLNIAFRAEPTAIFGASHDRCSPELLPGAQLNIVESCFQAPGDQVAVVTGSSDGHLVHRTYDELRSRANQYSNLLQAKGFVPGDRIGVILPITFESVAAYLGIIQAGMVAVSIADSFAGPEIASRLRIAEACAVLTYEKLVRAEKSFDLGMRVLQATDVPVFFIESEGSEWSSELAGQPDEFAALAGGAQDPINILFSSGTTGDPKAIPWNHATPIKCAIDGHLHHDLHPGDVVAWPTNLGWMMGPWLIFATLINKGTLAIYDDAPFGAGFGRFVQNAGVNMLGLVPSMVRLWKARRSMERFDWSQIKCFSSTGEASNADDMFYLSWLAGFRPIIEYCGGTEIGGGYISSTLAQPNAPATFSTAAFGMDVRILDEDHNPTDEGELYLVPPSLGLSVELLNRDHDDTYFSDCPLDQDGRRLRRHGDHFRRLPGGYYAAGGRADDTMNLGGIKVSSVEIEKTLNRLPQISETAAVAVPFEETGPDQLVIFYVLSDDIDEDSVDPGLLKRQMNESIRSNLNPLFKIKSIRQRDALPRTASNKVMRRLLRDEF